jgi:hypothetical protein
MSLSAAPRPSPKPVLPPSSPLQNAYSLCHDAYAAAMQTVGRINNGLTAPITAATATAPDAPAWLAAYASVSREEQVAFD